MVEDPPWVQLQPTAEMCWWVTDKFGVSWQLTPDNFTEYMRSDEATKKAKLMAATMEMRRLSFEGIDKAYNS
jgi:predicted 3-demethylubiquinone-9 3-methyltransferase (glyoxalase superfamily)